MCVSIYISIYPLTYVCMFAYLYLPIYQYLSIHIPTYLVYLLISVCPSIHSSVYLVYLFIYLSIHPPIYAVYLSINLCVLSLRKKPIFKFMPPFSLHLSLIFYRKLNTVAEIPLWVSAHRVLWNSCISIFSLSLCCAARFAGCIGEGNGNPLQYSCLENPRDGGAWWAAVYGVTQSWIRLKRLSSSNSISPTRDWTWALGSESVES